MKTFVSSAEGRTTKLEPDEKVTIPVETSVPEAAAPKRKRGRPPGSGIKLTPSVQQIICDVIAAGNYLKIAAEAAGINIDTLSKWRDLGDEGKEPYFTFVRALETAERDCERSLVKKVMSKTDDDWRAAMMMLERKYPERWSRYREQAAFESGEAGNLGVGFSIVLHLGANASAGCPKCDRDRTVEIEDHAKREREIENAEALAAAAIKDTL